MRFSAHSALESAHKILSASPLKSTQPNLRIGLESQILLAHHLQTDRVFLHTHPDVLLTPTQERHFFESIQKRALGYPIEYLTHKVSFYAREFSIDSHTLIPRPETEILIDKAQEILQTHDCRRIAEVGTGSGVIAITLALQNPHLHIYATDINPHALSLACKNAKHFGVGERITFLHTSLLDGLEGAHIDMLISNPPYIRDSYPLPLSVTYEPKEALFGGERGSEVLHMLIRLATMSRIRFVCCEMGYDQKAHIRDFVREVPHKSLEFYKDLSGFDRGFILQFF
ncbi:peptide chain release factor N(5)-glutamine methyltransferase [uncultured Helicobacter sp.]|uniref:peptide chain release factor N(5)-glutamine methyltransferase n=1 Tax=uncultured Helicobacter sp. TaxID=175537 RepID=UPI00374F9826